MTTQVILTVTEGPLEGQEFTIAGQEEVVVGRSSLCSLRLDDPAVSRRHCLLDVGGEWPWVKDLGSLNGTFVNDQDIGRHVLDAETGAGTPGGFKRLHDGDELRLGVHAFRVGVVTADPSANEGKGEPDLCSAA
jgi:eukaryotic-like serine/threonine-protein kinase